MAFAARHPKNAVRRIGAAYVGQPQTIVVRPHRRGLDLPRRFGDRRQRPDERRIHSHGQRAAFGEPQRRIELSIG